MNIYFGKNIQNEFIQNSKKKFSSIQIYLRNIIKIIYQDIQKFLLL